MAELATALLGAHLHAGPSARARLLRACRFSRLSPRSGDRRRSARDRHSAAHRRSLVPDYRVGSGSFRFMVRHRASIRSEEHTSELQSLMRISYAVFCLKKKKQIKKYTTTQHNYTKKMYIQ